MIVNEEMTSVLQCQASVPALGFGKSSNVTGVHVCPDRPTMSRTRARTGSGRSPAVFLRHESVCLAEWRQSRCPQPRRAGARRPCLAGIAVRSKCTRQTLGESGDSVLLPAMIDPSCRRTGLFLICQDAIGQPPAIAPRPPLVRRCADHAPPGTGVRSHFIEERELACAQLEENRIPRRVSPPVVLHACRHFYRWGPLAADAPRQPDADIGGAFRVPPNQAATRPLRVSTMVDACALANGADSKMNSTTSGSTAFTAAGAAMSTPANAHRRNNKEA